MLINEDNGGIAMVLFSILWNIMWIGDHPQED
jgi:hypothetical protein